MVAGFGKLKMILNDSRRLAVSTNIPMDVPKVRESANATVPYRTKMNKEEVWKFAEGILNKLGGKFY